MIFEENKIYTMESKLDVNKWLEIEVRYVVGDKVNFVIKNAFRECLIGEDHTFSTGGAFFTEYKPEMEYE